MIKIKSPFITKILLGTVAAVFIIFSFTSKFDFFGGKKNEIAAQVGNLKITESEINYAMQNELANFEENYGQSLSLNNEDRKKFRDSILDRSD